MDVKKYKELLLYLIFGVLTTLVNIGTFYLFHDVWQVYYLTSNAIAWVISIVFAYITNRKWVFDSASDHILEEFLKFTACRLFSGGCDMLVMFAGVDLLGISSMLMKVIANVLVVIMNYVFSKVFVFKADKHK